MSDDPTKKLPDDEPQENKGRIDEATQRMFSPVYDLQRTIMELVERFDAFNVRLESVELKLEQRQAETKPMWERALAEISETRLEMRGRFDKVDDQLSTLNEKIDILNQDILEVKA